MSLPSSMADFEPCDRLFQKAYFCTLSYDIFSAPTSASVNISRLSLKTKRAFFRAREIFESRVKFESFF